jgi:hypothetical protein
MAEEAEDAERLRRVAALAERESFTTRGNHDSNNV